MDWGMICPRDRPLLHACIPKRRRKTRTVAEGLPGHLWARDIHGVVDIHEVGQYLLLWRLIEATILSDAPDQLVWKWNASGTYTTKLAYLASFHSSATCSNWKLTWKSWAPPKVKFFHWLVSLDRCWTADRLARHGLQHHTNCPLSRHVWFEILSWMCMTCRPSDNEIGLLDWWHGARQATPKPMRKGWHPRCFLHPG